NTGRTVAPIAVTLTPSPELVVTAIAAPSVGQSGQMVTLDWTVSNTGLGLAQGAWLDQVYLAPGLTVAGATLLTTVQHSANLATGGSYTQSAQVVLPIVADGDYHIVVVTDASDTVYEGTGDSNNLRAADTPLTLGHPDLVPTLGSAPTTAISGTTVA